MFGKTSDGLEVGVDDGSGLVVEDGDEEEDEGGGLESLSYTRYSAVDQRLASVRCQMDPQSAYPGLHCRCRKAGMTDRKEY